MQQTVVCRAVFFVFVALSMLLPRFLTARLIEEARRYASVTFAKHRLEDRKVIQLFHPSLAELEQIKETLDPDHLILLSYFPYESTHWELVRRVAGEERLSTILPGLDYINKIKSLGFAITSYFSRGDFTFYSDQEALLAEIPYWPIDLSPQERGAISELAVKYSLPGIEEGTRSFPLMGITIRGQVLTKKRPWPVELSPKEENSILRFAAEHSLATIEPETVNFPFEVLVLMLDNR